MKVGIDRDEIDEELADLDYRQTITMSRDEARALIDLVPDELGGALDYAQGSTESGRYVLIYVEA